MKILLLGLPLHSCITFIQVMSAAAREFAQDPCSSVRRGNMVRAARNLLSAVTRLLILADKIDVHLLLAKLHRVEADLENLKNVSSQAELMESIKRFGVSAQDLMNQVQRKLAVVRTLTKGTR